MSASSASPPPLVVVGSVAVDWVITPKAERAESVGGSATFFSMAASAYARTGLVGVVGKDFPEQALRDLRAAEVDCAGLEVVDDGLTFRWKGRYHENMNDRDTLETHLNCFESFVPKLPSAFRRAENLFLANIQPSLQLEVLEQMQERPRLVGLDTMNLWIDIASDDLKRVLERVDVLLINDQEASQLTGHDSIRKAAAEIRALGPEILVIKRGEHGALLFGPEGDELFAIPGMPLHEVHDPTGAGDCFAGGFMGYLAQTDKRDREHLRRAMVHGSTMASLCVEAFSYDRLAEIDEAGRRARYEAFVRMTEIA